MIGGWSLVGNSIAEKMAWASHGRNINLQKSDGKIPTHLRMKRDVDRGNVAFGEAGEAMCSRHS